MVLYCLVGRRTGSDAPVEFLMLEKHGSPTFPPTRFPPREDLYRALVRTMEQDLVLPRDTYFPEKEMDMLPSAGPSHRYEGLARSWHLYPVWISLVAEGWQKLSESRRPIRWMTLDAILSTVQEPNVTRIAEDLRARTQATDPDRKLDLASMASRTPSMDALASAWAAAHEGGVRIVEGSAIQGVLKSGDRAFNLRVADPYLPYQKQGLGFTWSFFTPKDRQDIHVHGLPAVEVYGVLSGRLQLWFKPMNQRGVRTWQCRILKAEDWAEVEPLNCHFACWLDPEGLGTVIKAAGSGPLAGVGRLGVAGKASCQSTEGTKKLVCGSVNQCQIPPALRTLESEFRREFKDRDFNLIAKVAIEAQEAQEE
jgi:hypothetical protein